MRIPRLYCPDLVVGENTVPPQEAHHAGDVLRLRAGDRVILFDGNGKEGSAIVHSLSRRGSSVHVEFLEEKGFELSIRLTLAVAMPRAQRQGFLVEKCTELGVNEIWPIVTERSVVKPGMGVIEKLSKKSIEAAKQSQRCFVPTICDVQNAEDVWRRGSEFARAIICSPASSSESLRRVLSDLAPHARVIACVGPEGGWSEKETKGAASHGFRAVGLGPNVLRIETAAIAMCAAVAMRD